VEGRRFLIQMLRAGDHLYRGGGQEIPYTVVEGRRSLIQRQRTGDPLYRGAEGRRSLIQRRRAGGGPCIERRRGRRSLYREEGTHLLSANKLDR
jgi:hypothetical protein